MAIDVPTLLGKPIKRVEDPRFITGKGRYLDDIKLPGDDPPGHPAQPVRPRQHPLGRHRRRRKAMPGVAGGLRRRRHPVQPAADGLAGRRLGRASRTTSTRRGSSRRTASSGPARASRRSSPRRRARPSTRSRRSRSTTSRCRPSSTPRRRPSPARRSSTRTPRTTSCSSGRVGDKAGTDAALDDAEVVVRQRLVNQRLIPNPMEVRGDIGWYNPGTDEYTVWMSSQTPHIQRLLLAAFVTGIPEHKIRCISPDVGGAFGSKIFCYADMALVDVRQQGDRRPAGQVGREPARELPESTIHGRDHITYLEIAGKRDGEVTGLRVKTFANLGGRLSTIGPGIPTTLYARVLSGCYKIPNVYAEVTGVYTNTTFVDAYRGAGRPEATYVIERAMDLFADEIGMDRAAVRRKNFIPPDQFPYENPSGLGTASGGAKIYIDSGNYEPALDKALDDGRLRRPARRPRPRRRPAASSSASGSRTYIEVCGVAPSKWIGAVGEGWGAAMWESANIRVHLTGKVIVTMGTQPQGQGHETTYAQVVADELGIPMEDIDRPALRHAGHAVRLRLVRQPDLVGRHDGGDQGRRQDQGQGPRATPRTCSRRRRTTSRSSAPSTGSRARPTRRRRSRRSPSRSTSRSTPPEGMEPYLDETAYYDTPNCTWPFGTHIAIVEIDEETGEVELVRYIAVDDVGKKINPMIVDGQLHGGIAQGVGQALWEGAIYSDDGQLLSGSMLDYALPRASWLPNFELDETVTPSPVNPLGVKGVGEAGAIASHRRGRQRRHRRARARSASATSTCRSRPRPCGGRSRPRREARHDPGSVRLSAPGHPR